MEKRDSSGFVLGLTIGLGAGVVVGLILSPKASRQTRNAIRKPATDGEEYFEQRGAEFADSLKAFIRVVNRQRYNLSAAIENGKKAYRKASSGGTPFKPAAPPDIGAA